MTTAAAYHPIGGLEDLENGLNVLRRCQLMMVPEFKSMFWAMELHHRDIRLAHLTGKAKDLQEQAIRDTKFYNILVKMLCEVKEKRLSDQREGLRRVHTWYMANKHVLYSGPRFGKDLMKEEAKEVFLKATTPRELKRAKSAKERPSSNRVKVAPRRSGRLSIPSQSSSGQNKPINSFQSTPRMHVNQDDPNFQLYFDPGFLNQTFSQAPPTTSSSAEVGVSGQRPAGEVINEERENLHLDLEEPGAAKRLLSRPTENTASIAPLQEQSVNQGCPAKSFVKKAIHPLTSVLNPHGALSHGTDPKDAKQLEG